MMRIVLLSLGAALFYVSGAQAHGVHADCRVGSAWMGVAPHYHPGGYGRAVACGGGGRQPVYREPAYREGGAGYRRQYPQQPNPPGYGGDLNPGGYAGAGRGLPQGAIIGHGEAVGCVSSFSRVVSGQGTVCREIP